MDNQLLEKMFSLLVVLSTKEQKSKQEILTYHDGMEFAQKYYMLCYDELDRHRNSRDYTTEDQSGIKNN